LTPPANPLVSTLIPVYNRERYLAAAIESLLAQAYRPLEIVVIDDGSTDGSAEIARRYAPMVRYELQPHRGIASARNGGLALAQGEYLAFLDSDDLWEEGQLAVQMEVLRSCPEVDCLFGHVTEFISEELDPDAARAIVCRSEPMPSRGPGAIIKAEAFRRVGPFRAQGQVGEFIDWHLRADEIGLKSMMLPQVVIRRRLHASNQSREQQSSRLDYVRILKASLDRRRSQGEGGAR
jgi:glycosyltransferase involved in cell wall biosynthesis